MKRGGFGLTLPFNASLASQVFRAANATESRHFIINACYPDAVNSLLAALGPSDRLIGVGNAAIIESLYRATSRQQRTIRVVRDTLLWEPQQSPCRRRETSGKARSR